jgi:hypothetical protein
VARGLAKERVSRIDEKAEELLHVNINKGEKPCHNLKNSGKQSNLQPIG